MKKYLITFLASAIFLTGITFMLNGCKNKDDKSVNIFSVEDDIALGKELEAYIAANPQEYPILNENDFPEAYSHLLRIRNTVLNSGKVFYKDRFEWKTKIIHDDAVLNAFCAPGGYIYVYTGLIKYLDTEDEFAGVMAHEIAHADRRHSTDQLTKQYGILTLLSLLSGEKDPGLLAQVAAGLLTLSFSRKDEKEADEYSVVYLCPTDYNAAGAAGFFQKIEDQGGVNVPQFLSTHPNPENRIQAIHGHRSSLGCTGNQVYDQRYQSFKNSLP